METDLQNRVAAALEELRLFSPFAGIFFRFDEPRPPFVNKGVCRFCSGCTQHPRAGGLCQNSTYAAAVQCFSIGDVWYTRCWLGVDCFVVPIAPQNELIGAIEVGGFFSKGEGDKTQQKILSRLTSLDSHGTLEEFVTALQGMQEMEFMFVRAAAEFLLEATFAKGLNRADEFSVRQQIFRAQQRLSSTIPAARGPVSDQQKMLEGLLRLLRNLEAGNGHDNRRELDEFVTALLADTQGEPLKFKGGLLPFLALIAYSRLQKEEGWHAVMGGFEKRLLELEKLSTVQEVCSWMEKLILPEAASSLAARSAGEHPLASRLEEWLQKRHGEKVNLEQAAVAVGVSRSSLVHRLKRETGHTFGELLSATRVCEAKRLLAFTSLSIGEIGRRCGFRDQSYVTKVFQNHINLTPSEFRRLLIQHLPVEPGL